VLIVGCGDIGRRVATLLMARGCRVTGVVRSSGSAARLRAAGIAVCRRELDAPSADSRWAAGFDGIFYFAPPPPEGAQDPRMDGFLAALDPNHPPQRIVYISTSAVYGDCRGNWITEAQPECPATERGQRRLYAEHRLREWSQIHATGRIILRVPGIYGPGKLPLARLKKGLPVLREAEAPYTNRIHAADLAAACVAAMYSEHRDTVYNVSDGHPSNMTDYFFRVADAAGLPRPAEVSREEAAKILSPGMLSFLQDSRRMDNTRLLEELGIELQYPDLVTGLPSCFE